MDGNHGPAYYQRYPPAFRRFTPTCDTVQLGHCSRREIVNSYDNAVLYADHVIARTIDLLKEQPGYDTALVYVSDHGESLGEDSLYLHGVPRAIAPSQQTQVPMVMWFSPGFARQQGLDLDRSEEHTSELQSLMRISSAVFCLNKKNNQDYIKPRHALTI